MNEDAPNVKHFKPVKQRSIESFETVIYSKAKTRPFYDLISAYAVMERSAAGFYCTGPGGVWIFDPDGRHLGTIVTPEQPANCAWGDDDWQSLYITAHTSVYKIRSNIQGVKVL